ncbi:flippase [Azospirillum sp.]|uniref:flippase n=1 Tax=Azospirillum sp. TaxID=34012 RepID=UPI003D71EABE
MLLRNTIWNLLGEGLPMAAALLSIPWMIATIGLEHFGFLTLIWALLGYLSLLDLGLVRSLVQILAERRSRLDGAGDIGIAGPALGVMAVLGLVTGGVVVAAAGPLTDYVLHTPGAAAGEIRTSLMIVGLIVPVALVSAALRGMLEAYQQFRPVNLVRMVVGVMNYLSPLCVLPFSGSLVWIIAAIAFGRVLGLLAFGWLCLRVMPDLLSPSRYPRVPLRPLFRMGGWMMLNNLTGPVMVYGDRFILASLVPAATVVFYTTTLEVLSRLLFIPGALSAVLFPIVAGLFARNPQALGRILTAGGYAIFGVFLVVQAAVVVSGGAALELWLGPTFAAQGGPILAVLALGVLFNAVAFVPHALIQGIGRVDVTAKLQLIELPVYLGVLWALVALYGPMGAAIAWSLRTGADLLLLLLMLPTLAPNTRSAAVTIGWTVGLSGAAVALGLAIGGETGAAVRFFAVAGSIVTVGSRLLKLRHEDGMRWLWQRCSPVAARYFLPSAVPGAGDHAGR